jgi:hypothetical protein
MSEFWLAGLSDPSALWPIRPGWGMQVSRQVSRPSMRTRGGELFACTWERHFAVSLPLVQVEEECQSALSEWWRRGAVLAWLEIDSAGPNTVLARVENPGRPLGRREPPDGRLLAGTVRLEGIGRDGDRVRGAPFILDHARFGTLDTFNVLL